jgi:curli production assembly/transport component CsgG/holdfast attachment protein HfaB
MSRSSVRTLLLSLALSAAAMAGAGAAAAAPDVTSVAPATTNPSPYTPALACMADRNRALGLRAPRLSVGRISDLTGRVDFDTGARVSQGAALFAITALGRAGAPVVERLDNSVSQIELDYAQKHLLSDTPERAGRA